MDLDTRIINAIPKLIEHGLLKKEKGEVKVAVPVLTSQQWTDMCTIKDRLVNDVKEKLVVPLKKCYGTYRKSIPKHLKSV